MRVSLAVYLAGLVLAAPVHAFDPVSLPPAAVSTHETQADPAALSIPTGVFDGSLPVETIEGAVHRRAWRIPSPDLPLLTIVRGLRADLERDGYDTLLDCETDVCGGFDFRFGVEVLPAPAMNADLFDFRVITARRDIGGAEEHVYIFVSKGRSNRYVQVFSVVSGSATGAEVAPETRAVPALISRLQVAGHVVLSDLDFATGAGGLSDRRYASLEALAGYLKGDAARVVAVVGHTDAVGSLEANTALSRQRAAAVRERLITRYGVAEAQVLAQGAGFLAPVASNMTAQGREANRRVEVVLLSK